jgi:transcriptional regulator GlxA family with amidase domain
MDHQDVIDSVIALADMSEMPVSVDFLAKTLGVPDRTLRYIWVRHFGISPGRYLGRRRLDQARSALIKAEPSATVTDIATQHGFFELGRFAVTYRQQYGEVPSATLRGR